MNSQRNRGIAIKPEGRDLIEKKRGEKGYSLKKLAELAEIDIKTLNTLLRGEPKDRNTIEAIAKALEISPTDIVDADEWFSQSVNTTQKQEDVNWLEVSHTVLNEQQIRRKASAMGFEVNVHVPLGLVQRKQQQRRDESVPREQVYQLDEEFITKTYEHKDFLQQVISQNSGDKNKNIAIVGEPGAGKTTLLNAIASHIKEENKDLVIVISLANLQGMKLDEYILTKWLPHAMGLSGRNSTPEIENQLINRFYAGNVWLLLDGVDEMGESSSIKALNKISQALTVWVGQARVVLTCRLNVWDASLNNNILPEFDTYKIQEFTPQQVDEFIEEWFKYANNMPRGYELKAELDLRERFKLNIRALVANPLMLSILCEIYQNRHGELPETKTEIFHLYLQHFYDWKPECITKDLTYTLRKQLHEALGRLALAGIDSKYRFQLPESLAVDVMTQELFNLACELGWLNPVNINEKVYAFLHPNFQEYFAALAIDYGHYFLNHVPDNPEDGTYRIFDPQWKEVIMFWMEKMKTDDLHKKEEFKKYVHNFQDNCWGIYKQKASDVICPIDKMAFEMHKENDSLFKSLKEENFNTSNTSLNSEQGADSTLEIEKEPISLLPESDIDSSKKMSELINLLDTRDIDTQKIAAKKIADCITHTNKNVQDSDGYTSPVENIIQTLLTGLEYPHYQSKYEIISILFDIDSSEVFLRLLDSQDRDIRLCAAIRLGELEPNNKKSIETIIDMMESTYPDEKYDPDEDYDLDCNIFYKIVWAINKLRKIQNYDYSQLIENAIDNINTNQHWYIRIYLFEMLREIGIDSPQFIELLKQLISSDDNRYVRAKAAYTLGRIERGNQTVINTLEKLLIEMRDEILDFSCSVTPSDLSQKFAVEIASNLLKLDSSNSTALQSLLYLICGSKYLDFGLECLLDSLEENIDALLKLSGDEIVIVNKSTDNFWFLWTLNFPDNIQIISVTSFSKIHRGKREVLLKNANSYIPFVKEIFKENFASCYQHFSRWFEEDKKWQKILSQWRDQKKKQNPKNSSMNGFEGEQKFIQDNRPTSSIAYEICREFLVCCAENMTYPEFYRAWHGELSPIKNLESQFTDTDSLLTQLQPTDKTYPLILNLQTLQGETDISAISQEICNQIYFTAFTKLTEIPSVNNAPQLKRIIPEITNRLQTEKLALIIKNCEPNQEIVTFCKNLTDVLDIAFITDQPLDAPLKGFPQNQSNLLSAIQNWINEIE
ncbi:NACHT domain-containing protein [Nodularia harveyana UHCC-0300]|uniref:NACHT domain-containing protein n=1 Tax=Nodularia harveyana UHCC-0300 TaxID=2974287 RepID=A0ABU5UAK7_9CYAN|nr:NACHT domain-containing protein [Nodularia harveyana]MEA5580383.1 NACHT domain-containing protein [Nodularia harveyana UHCC-0300]